MLAVDGSKTEDTGKEAMETGSIGYSKLSGEEKKDGQMCGSVRIKKIVGKISDYISDTYIDKY